MSHATEIHAVQSLLNAHKRAVDTTDTRALRVIIKDETLVEDGTLPFTTNLQADFDKLHTLALNPPACCYLLVRLAYPRQWLVIICVPDNALPRDKMVYAATLATLQNDIGINFFKDQWQISLPSEITHANYVRACSSVPAYSNFEIERQNVHKAEDEERDFRAKQMSAKNTRNTNPDLPGAQKSGGIGGYHSVTVTLQPGSKEKLAGFPHSTNWIELKITDCKTQFCVVKACTASSPIASNLVTNEPRFYLHTCNNRNLLIYVCPSASAPSLRMVYSTCKSSVEAGIRAAGVQLDNIVEQCDLEDVTDKYIQECASEYRGSVGHGRGGFGGAGRGGGVGRGGNSNPVPDGKGGFGPGTPSWASSTTSSAKSTKTTKTTAPHPVYSLMNTSGQAPSCRKKIVLPPDGAW